MGIFGSNVRGGTSCDVKSSPHVLVKKSVCLFSSRGSFKMAGRFCVEEYTVKELALGNEMGGNLGLGYSDSSVVTGARLSDFTAEEQSYILIKST